MEKLRIISDNSISLFYDNKAAINIAHNSVQHNRTKHIEIDMCFIKEKINDGIIYILFANSKNQLADIFTKHLSSRMFHSISCEMNIKDIYTQF
jgi:hypothetical protein